MKKVLYYSVFVAIFCSNSLHVSGWGKKGHTIVVEIAYYLIDSNTKLLVNKCLNNMPPVQSGNWMDEIKSEHKYDFMKPWHYLNVEKGESYTQSNDANIINSLNNAIKELEHKGKLNTDEIKKNLIIIFHLVADLHQPLHVGYGTDKGGNDIQVKYLNKESNLHRVWDTEIIESEAISLNDCLSKLSDFDKPFLDRQKIIKVETWMNQPRSLLNKVYKFENGKIDQTYIYTNKKIIEEQLLIAGIRLSAVLEHIFKS